MLAVRTDWSARVATWRLSGTNDSGAVLHEIASGILTPPIDRRMLLLQGCDANPAPGEPRPCAV